MYVRVYHLTVSCVLFIAALIACLKAEKGLTRDPQSKKAKVNINTKISGVEMNY